MVANDNEYLEASARLSVAAIEAQRSVALNRSEVFCFSRETV